MGKRLVIISVVGIVLVGGLYWYTNSRTEVPPAPLPPLARPDMGARPTPPPIPVKSPPVKPNAVKPRVALGVPGTEEKQTAAPLPMEGPQRKVPPVVARSAETPPPGQLARAGESKVKGEKRYTVQVASLVVERNAVSLEGRLAKLGYSPFIRRTIAPITRHRVYGGKFTSRQEAEQTTQRLNVDGFSSNLVEMGRGQFALEVGWSFNLNDAIDMARSLQKKNYTPKIDSKATPTPVHQVRVGEYENRSDALQVLEALKRDGFSPLLVQH